MKKPNTKSSSGSSGKRRPALTPEARENQLISMAYDAAEKQLMDGTASSQVISHFLKLGSMKERTEQEIRELEKELIAAKTENLKSQKRTEELFAEAIKAFGVYSGRGGEIDDEDEDY